jgi:hypothetical protein
MKILTFNHKLRKITNSYEHVTVIECCSNREFYTQCGLHLNRRGKRLIFEQIVSEIYKLTTKEVETPISLQWVKESSESITITSQENVCEETINNVIVDSLMDKEIKVTQNKDEAICRISSRPKKAPVTRNTDFLW